jgi:hypothetical protein
MNGGGASDEFFDHTGSLFLVASSVGSVDEGYF